jgi:hypothetical protein
MRPFRYLLLLPLAACVPTLGDDDDNAGDDDTTDDDDATGDDDDATGDDDDVVDDDDIADDDDSVGDDDDTWGCEESITKLGWSDESPLGFSGNDVLDLVAGPVSAEATWSALSATTQITYTVAGDGAVLFHDLSEGPPPPGGPKMLCLDWLEVQAVVSFETADGVFDEAVAGSIMVQDGGVPSFWGELDPDSLSGSFDWSQIPDFDPAEWDEVGINVSCQWTDGGLDGQIDMFASRTTAGGVSEAMIGPILLY